MEETHHFERLGKKLGKIKVCWGEKRHELVRISTVYGLVFYWENSLRLAVTFRRTDPVWFCLQVDPPSARLTWLVPTIESPTKNPKNFSCCRDLPVKLKRSAGARQAGRDDRRAAEKRRRSGGGIPLTNTLRCARAGACARAPPSSGAALVAKHSGKWRSEGWIVYYIIVNIN